MNIDIVNLIFQLIIWDITTIGVAYLQHSKKFEQRVKEMLRGRTFEPKHLSPRFNFPLIRLC